MDYNNELIKASINGGALSLASIGLIANNGFKSNLIIKGNYKFPLWISFFVLGFGNSMLIDWIHKIIRDNTDVSQKVNDQTDMILGLALGGIGVVALSYLLAPGLIRQDGIGKLLLVGAGSELAGQFGSN